MKILLASLFGLSLIFTQTYGQSAPQIEADKLTVQVAELFKAGKFDEAIPLAQKAVNYLKKEPRDYEKLASAMVNLAVLKKEKGKIYLYGEVKDKVKARRELSENFLDAELLLDEVIEIHTEKLKAATPQLALSLGEIAWIISVNPYKSGREPNLQKRFDKAEEYYGQAITIKEKIFGQAHPTTLETMLVFADFEMNRLNMEKALTLYSAYVSTVEKSSGAESKSLIDPLRTMALILVATDNEKEAATICEKVSRITGEPEKTPESKINLSRRRILDKNQSSGRVASMPISAVVLVPGTISSAGNISGLPPGALFFPGAGSLSNMLPRSSPFPPAKNVYVKVLINEQGEVVEAIADTKDEKLKSEAEKEVAKGKYRPFVYQNTARKMRGWVIYSY